MAPYSKEDTPPASPGPGIGLGDEDGGDELYDDDVLEEVPLDELDAPIEVIFHKYYL